MRKLIPLAVLVTALVATAVAVADGFGGASNPTAVAGSFSATQVKTSSRTCTTSDNRTIVVTDGAYQGTSSGDATLTGAITLRARSVVDTTNKVGLVTGRLRIDTSSDHTNAAFQAVYSAGHVAGLADGRAAAPHTALVANLSADFDPATGFSNGKLGGATTGGNAVELTPRACGQAKTVHERSAAHGTISAVSSTSITVAGLTCNLPQGSDVPTKYHQNDVVTIQCELSNGVNTLTKIEGKHH